MPRTWSRSASRRWCWSIASAFEGPKTKIILSTTKSTISRIPPREYLGPTQSKSEVIPAAVYSHWTNCVRSLMKEVIIGTGKVKTLTLSVFKFINEANVFYAAFASVLLVIPPMLLVYLNKKMLFFIENSTTS